MVAIGSDPLAVRARFVDDLRLATGRHRLQRTRTSDGGYAQGEASDGRRGQEDESGCVQSAGGTQINVGVAAAKDSALAGQLQRRIDLAAESGSAAKRTRPIVGEKLLPRKRGHAHGAIGGYRDRRLTATIRTYQGSVGESGGRRSCCSGQDKNCSHG